AIPDGKPVSTFPGIALELAADAQQDTRLLEDDVHTVAVCLRPEITVTQLDAAAPFVGKGMFDAAADRPANMRVAVGQAQYRCLAMGYREATGRVDQGPIHGESGAQAQRTLDVGPEAHVDDFVVEKQVVGGAE